MKILQVELLTADLALTEHFYSGKLQLKLLRKNDTELSYIAGHSMLTFTLTTSLRPCYHIAFEIPCNKLDEAINWLGSRTALIPYENGSPVVDFKNWNARSVYFCDDNRNILEFIVRYDNDMESTDAFDAASILNISEVGFVHAAVLRFAAALTDTYGLQHYDKQPPGENFCAMGDAGGLFILSGDERNWFPMDTKAAPWPVYVKFEEGGNLHELYYK